MATFRENIISILFIFGTAIYSMLIPSEADASHTEMNLEDSDALAYCKNIIDFYYYLDQYSDEELGEFLPSDLAYIGAGMNLAFEENFNEIGLPLLMKAISKINEELLLDYGSKAMRDPLPETLHLLGLESIKSQMEAVGFSDRAERLVGMYFNGTLDSEVLEDLKDEGFKLLTNYGHQVTGLLKHFNKTARSKKRTELGYGFLVMFGIEIVTLFKQCRDAG